MEGLIGTATWEKDGLMSKKLQTVACPSMGRIMRIKKGTIVNFLISTNHTYNPKNNLVIVQAICTMINESSVRYHTLIPKNNDIVRFDLRYLQAEDNNYIDLSFASKKI